MFRFLKNYQKNASARLVPVAPKPWGSTFALTPISLRKPHTHSWTPKRPNRALRHPALIETPLQDPRGSVKEGSTVVSTV